MTEKYGNDLKFCANLAEAYTDDTLFERSIDALYSAGIEASSREDLLLSVGLGLGTVMRLRKRITELENKHDG